MKTFAVVGNDGRQQAAAEYLAKLGYDVFTAENVHLADYILLPMPLNVQNVSQTQLLHAAKKGAIAFAGKVCPQANEIAKSAQIELIDYLVRDDLAMLNAIPTVEGAVEIIMKARTKTLWSSKILVTGFGRIARLLCHHLKAFGAEVTVCARKPADRAEAFAFGYKAAAITGLSQVAKEMDVLVNTVPAMLITKEVLAQLSKEALVVDLASVPGGVDFETAKKMGIPVEWALSLPAKTAPVTAGEFVVKTVLEIIAERVSQGEN